MSLIQVYRWPVASDATSSKQGQCLTPPQRYDLRLHAGTGQPGCRPTLQFTERLKHATQASLRDFTLSRAPWEQPTCVTVPAATHFAAGKRVQKEPSLSYLSSPPLALWQPHRQRSPHPPLIVTTRYKPSLPRPTPLSVVTSLRHSCPA